MTLIRSPGAGKRRRFNKTKTCKTCRHSRFKDDHLGRLLGECNAPYELPPAPSSIHFAGGARDPKMYREYVRPDQGTMCPHWAPAEEAAGQGGE